jgi:hypothetical protein
MRSQLSRLLLLAITACEGPFGTTRELTVEDLRDRTLGTDRNLYEATLVDGEGAYRTYAVTMVAEFTNAMDQPVYLGRCLPDTDSPIYGILSVEPELEAGYDPIWACVGHDNPILVGAGESRVDTLRLSGPNAWDGYTKEPFGTLTGRFQLSYAIGTCPDVYGCGVVQSYVESNEFEMRLKP